MTVNKQFAQDGTALDDHMDALIGVLAELLGDPENPPPEIRGGVAEVAELRSDADRVIHVVVNDQEK